MERIEHAVSHYALAMGVEEGNPLGGNIENWRDMWNEVRHKDLTEDEAKAIILAYSAGFNHACKAVRGLLHETYMNEKGEVIRPLMIP